MFRAIGRYFRAIGYMFTGRIDAARKTLSSSPHVVNATYDQVIADKRQSVHQFKDAIARLIVQHEQKMSQIRTLTQDVNRFERLKEGAAAKARAEVERLKAGGGAMDEIKTNEDYLKCLRAFNDFSAMVEEKQARIGDLEHDVTQFDESIKGHKLQLQQMLKEMERLREEQATTVAEMLTAKEEEQINSMLAGISTDRTSRELGEMRQLRDEMKAKARVARELAGTDTKAEEADFLAYAQNSLVNDEFDQLIGLAEDADQQADTAEAEEQTKLPE